MKKICLLPLVMTILTVNMAFASTGTSGAVSNILENPGFESGSTIWVASSDIIQNAGGQLAHGGSWLAELNGYGYVNTDTLYQTVTIPATVTSATLSFWLHIDTAETTISTAYDKLSVQVQNSSGTVLNTLATYSNLDKNTGYVQKSLDLSPYKGQTVRLSFKGTEDYSLKTSFVLDDFILSTDSTSTPPPPTTLSCAPAPTSTLSVNVKDKGAMGNGSTNDTVAIQAAIDQVAGTGGTVLVPDGTYMIDAVTRLYLKDDMTFRMSSGTVLKAIPNSQSGYAIIDIENITDVNVIGGTVQGERALHTGTTGQYGLGIGIYSSNRVVIEGVTAKDSWGDGFYIGRWPRGSTNRDVKLCSVIADNNRRQGITITTVDGAVIKNSTFKNTNGSRPMAGMDIEPNDGDSVNNVQILNSQFLGNYGGGLDTYIGTSGIRSITNLTLDGNTMSNNGGGGIYAPGMNISATSGVRITNNIVQNNKNDGIEIENGSTHNTVDNNTVSGNKAYGIQIYDSTSNYNTISNNTVTGNGGRVIVDKGTGNTIIGNTVQ